MTGILGFLLAVLAVAYAASMGRLWAGFRRVARQVPDRENRPDDRLFLSIVIPARNEAGSIGACLQSVFANDHDRFEVIVSDDGSDDGTPDVVAAFGSERGLRNRLRLVRPGVGGKTGEVRGGKREALSRGISAAKGDIIVSTDADSMTPRSWLGSIEASFSPGTQFVVGAVAYSDDGSFIQRVLALELFGLVAAAGGGIANGRPNMCNGANLAYRRSAYDRAHGFRDTESTVSGDDTKLMLKIHSEHGAGSVAFCPNPHAVVLTSPPQGWRDILNQRLRWASKSTDYGDPAVTVLAAIVLAFHALLLAGFVWCVFAPQLLAVAFPALLLKIVVEGLLLSAACRHFDRLDLMRVFLPAQVIQIPYVVIVGILGLLGVGFSWKGRRYRR